MVRTRPQLEPLDFGRHGFTYAALGFAFASLDFTYEKMPFRTPERHNSMGNVKHVHL